MSRFFISAFCLVLSLSIKAQPAVPIVVAGPVIGNVTQHTARLWIGYKGNVPTILTLQDTLDKTIITPIKISKLGYSKTDTAAIADFEGLQSGHCYAAVSSIKAKKPVHCSFVTPDDSAVKDFDFLVGSCALMNTGITRVAFPGASVRIFRHMAQAKASMMVWLGDNIYYLINDFKSYSNMFFRNLDVRCKFGLLNTFLATQPNYTIWDDHDYGWNDSDKHFPLKDTALIVYKAFWPNYYVDSQITYFTFRRYDAQFFMTDGRWFRDKEGDTSTDFLGQQQLIWLKNELQNSNATFKFICIGSQVLNDNHHGESYAKFPKERNELLDFIADRNIKGVIFLTGDKHYSELSLRDWRGYPLFDFTCSPITSPVVARNGMAAYKNSYSVKGSVFYRKNYGRIYLTGHAGARVCHLELHGKSGAKIWEYSIDANSIQKK